MIGYLKGRIIESWDSKIIVDTQSGVGYLVEVPNNVLGSEGDIELYIYTHLKETELKLFGFRSKMELDLFEKLISVNGVGPKSAMGILKEKTPEDIISAIMSEKPEGLKVSGIGTKTTQKIVIELRGKLEKIESMSSVNKEQTSFDNEIVEALLSLGYTEREVKRVIGESKDLLVGLSTQDSIRLILKYLRK